MIEDPMFSAEMNLAAGKKAFRREMRAHALFTHLLEFAKTREGRETIMNRVAELADRSIDREYENPADVAFCAYLTALADTAEPEVIARAASAVTAAPNCSWSFELSRELLSKAYASGMVAAETRHLSR